MDAIPTVSPLKESCWRVLVAVMCATALPSGEKGWGGGERVSRGSSVVGGSARPSTGRGLLRDRQLGNATFKGTGEDDAVFTDLAPLRVAASCLGCEEAQLTKVE